MAQSNQDLDALPPEVIDLIAGFSPLDAHLNLTRTCSSFSRVARHRLCSVRQLCLQPFGQSLQGIVSARSLQINGRCIGPAHTAVLAQSCVDGAMQSCTTLDMSDNCVGDDGVRALSHAMAKGALEHVTVLSLYKNDIADTGVVALARALSLGALKHVTSLILNSNRIGNEGVIALSRAACKGALSQLVKLCLSANQIGDTVRLSDAHFEAFPPAALPILLASCGG